MEDSASRRVRGMNVVSSGAVIFRRTGGQRLFLLLNYPSGHWDFVKGKMEDGETPRETATREAQEETGIRDLEFVDGFAEETRYDFYHDGRPVCKKVVFFLAESHTERVVLSQEHVGFSWLDPGAALDRITYDNSRRILARADLLLSGGP